MKKEQQKTEEAKFKKKNYCVGLQEPHDLYNQLIEREARHGQAHLGHQPKQAWNPLPVGLPVNPQLDLAAAAASSHNSTGLFYGTAARRYVPASQYYLHRIECFCAFVSWQNDSGS